MAEEICGGASCPHCSLSGQFMIQTRFGLAAVLMTATAFAQSHVPGRLLVHPRADADPAQVTEGLRRHGAQVEDEVRQIGVKILRVPEHAVERVREALSKSGHFSFVELEGVGRGSDIPNDPSFAAQWHLNKIDAPNAWLTSTGAAGAPIAIIDSGVDGTHPDLASKLLPGWSFLLNSADTSDVLGHGTKTAGAAAAIANNALGIAGIAWANPILPVVVLDSSNYASYSNIAKAITYAADRGARILSISINGNTSSSTLQSAVDYAWNKGALVIACAGNQATTAMQYPAACNRVIAVGATDSNDALASFSNRGTWVDLVAPGVSIMTTVKGGGYGAASGTSFSTPITAGVGALILALQPSMSVSALDQQLRQAVDDLGTAGFDAMYGAGLINAFKAVTNASLISTLDTTAPAVRITSPKQNSIVRGVVYIQGSASDDVLVRSVEFWVNGVLRETVATSNFSFVLDTTQISGTKIAVRVRAIDSSENTGEANATYRR
jgi:subtilisin family serine protease